MSIRIVTFFPIDFPHASERSSWPPEQLVHLRAGSEVWRTPGPTDDLALQEYGHDVLDSLLRSMPAAVLEAELKTTGVDDPSLRSPAEGWSLADSRISLWNLGNGLASFTYDIADFSGPEGFVAATRRHVYALAPAVERLVAELTAWEDSKPIVLWGNPVYAVRVDAGTSEREKRQISRTLTDEGIDCDVQGIIRIGRHCSVVAESFDDPAVDLLQRLVGVHQVCWGAALLYDARLGRELALIRPDPRSVRLSELQHQADRILTTYHLVRMFRLRYGSVEAHLDGGASRLWHALEESWKFPLVLTSLDERLDFVRTFHEQLFARLQDSRSKLLNELVLAFTFLNLFSIALGAMTFGAEQSLTVRTAAAIAMGFVLALNVGVYLFFRRRLAGDA